MSAWPTAGLTDRDHLHLLAAALPGGVVEERVFDLPFDEVWRWIGDLERSVPAFDRAVAGIEVRARDGERLRIVARSPWWTGRYELGFDVQLRPGWCLMTARSGIYMICMVASPEGDRTRFTHLEAVMVRGPRWRRALLGPALRLARWRTRRHVAHDLDGMERGLGLRSQG